MAKRIARSTVVEFAAANPTLRLVDIAAHFGISADLVGKILRNAGVVRRRIGPTPKRRACQTDTVYKWETILCKLGLGMDRGLHIGKGKILYGEEYSDKKEGVTYDE